MLSFSEYTLCHLRTIKFLMCRHILEHIVALYGVWGLQWDLVPFLSFTHGCCSVAQTRCISQTAPSKKQVSLSMFPLQLHCLVSLHIWEAPFLKHSNMLQHFFFFFWLSFSFFFLTLQNTFSWIFMVYLMEVSLKDRMYTK